MRFILASSSPRRRELIASLGIAFDIIKPDIDETQHADEHPLDYVQRLSREKADAVAHMIDNTPAIILAADTVVILGDEILGKPVDATDARAILGRLRGRGHVVCTAFTLLNTESQQIITQPIQTTVHMRDYSDDEIEAYIATGDCYDKAGGYAIQHPQFKPVQQIDGDYNNVVGLPLDAVRVVLDEMGLR
jgi:septum formation protein